MAQRKLEVVIVGNSSSLKRAVGESETALGRLNKGMLGGAKSALKFAATSAGIAGVGVAISKTISTTVDFDKSMRNVNSIAQLNEKRFGALEKSVVKLAGKTAQAPKTLADGLYDLVSSGFNAKQSMTILASSAKAATAGLTTTEVSTKAVAAVLNAYHEPASQAANISDVLFQTVNRGVITFEDLANNIGTVLPFAASLGVGLNQVGASISTMTKQGISGELSITFLKNAMVSFLKPSKGMEAAIKATGFASGEALVKAKGFQGALDAVRGTTDGSKKAMAALFPNIRSLTAALALTGKNAKSAGDDLKAFKDVTGATDKALSQQQKSVSYQWNKVKAIFAGLAITVGSALIPVMKNALEHVAKFVTQMENGTGAGGRFRDKMEQIWQQVKPIGEAVAHAAIDIAKFTDTHVGVRNLLIAFLAFKAAVITTKATLAGYNAVMAAGKAIATAYRAAMIGLTAIRFGWANLKAQGVSGGGQIGAGLVAKMGAVVMAGIAGWEIGSWLRKHVPAVRAAGDALGKGLANFLDPGIKEAEKFDAKMAQITGNVQNLAQQFRNATNPVQKNTAAIKLHAIAAQASAAQWRKVADGLRNAGATMDGTDSKSAQLRNAMHQLAAKEQEAASWAQTLKGYLDALPASKTINVSINQHSTGGGAFGINSPAPRKGGPKAKGSSVMGHASTAPIFGLEASLASAQGLRDATQAGFDAADQAARRAADIRGRGSKDKSTRNSAIADLKALNLEISRAKRLGAIDLKITGYEKAIRFKDAISQIRGSIHDLTSGLADKFRDKLTKGIADSADAKELANLQAQDKDAQDRRTKQQLDQALADAIASGDKDAQQQAQDDIAAYARQKREEELQANLDAANANVDNEVQAYQDGLDLQVSALVDSLEQRKQAYADFVASLAAMGITFTASSDQEQAINLSANPTGVGNRKKKVKGKHKKHRAMGGPVSAGEAYIVGERGQETFVPDQNGRIIPHGSGGAYVHVDNMNIRNTTDVQRWASRLAFKLATA